MNYKTIHSTFLNDSTEHISANEDATVSPGTKYHINKTQKIVLCAMI